MNTMFKKFATGTAALALMTTVFASGAMAEGTSVGSTITGGEFTLSTISTTAFTGTTLDGKIQNDSTASIQPFTITDARGLGDGWNVSISATPFTNIAAPVDLSPNTLSIAVPAVTAVEGSSLDSNLAKLGGAIDNGVVKMVAAGVNEGMGTYNVAATQMTLNLKPKEVYAGTYATTVTVGLTTGP